MAGPRKPVRRRPKRKSGRVKSWTGPKPPAKVRPAVGVTENAKKNTVETELGADKPTHAHFANLEQMNIVEFVPAGPDPKTEVHLLIHSDTIPFPIALRFTGPETIGLMIEHLNGYREKVWPDAEEIDFDFDPGEHLRKSEDKNNE